MNRRERRAAFARGKLAASAPPVDIARLFADANQAFRSGQSAQAEASCKRILARAPAHTRSLNLLGLINQAAGRHRLAVKMFAKAIAADDQDAACHYNIASSYQLLDEPAAAAAHFNKAIALGLSGQDVGDLAMQNPDIAEAIKRTSDQTSSPAGDALFGEREIRAIAKDIFLQCALQSTLICGLQFEFLLTQLRFELLRVAQNNVATPGRITEDVVGFFCALAQQCFINEYVFLQSAEETKQADRLRHLLLQKLAAGGDIAPILLAAVAAYFPLYSVPGAQALLHSAWPVCAAELLRQQIAEPLEEAADRKTIAALTEIDDATSIQVMRQYEENPYPRWTISPAFAPAAAALQAGLADRGDAEPSEAILIAGCGTGRHAFDVARQSPRALVLAIDISRASLAYARRKAREAGLQNIEYAAADILKLGSIGRTFDRIEAVGVLHHLADPKAGWRVLLSLLKPKGVMRVGLYSEMARRSIVEARALVAQRGYSATSEGIRALRQAMIREHHNERWKSLIESASDFYCTSGCRDLFFNVMEHQFTISQIAALLAESGLSFLGFELDPATLDMFGRRYPGGAATTNLEYWRAFEMAHPQTFRRMYVFSVRRRQPSLN